MEDPVARMLAPSADNTRLRIALVSGAFLPQVGGVEFGAYNLAKQLQLRGHAVYVITSRPLAGTLAPFEMLDGIPVHRLRFYLFRGSWKSLAAMIVFMPLACIQYARLIRRERVDVINVRFFYHNAFATWLIRPLLTRWRIPVVITLEGGDAPNIPEAYRSCHRVESSLLTWVARRFLPAAERVSAVSALLRYRTQQRIARVTDCAVVHNGVDPALFAPGQLRTAHEMVSVGRLSHEKGYDILFRAFAMVHERYPSWHLTVVGDGPLRADLRTLLQELQLTSCVDMRGACSQTEVAEILGRSAMFVLASRFEGFPLAALEAMACGTPVVMADVEGARELIPTSERGRVVPIDDVSALSSALDEMIALGPDRLRDMGAACRKWVEATHSWERIALEYEIVFTKALAVDRKRADSPRRSGATRLP